jgi:hypothetical protein
MLGGCSAIIVPPAAPERPLRAAILDHGRHSSLMLELPAGQGLVRYSYGDWDWYALGRTGVGQGSAALLWPTQAALGRRRFAAPAVSDADVPAAAVALLRIPAEDAYWFPADEDRVRALVAALEEIFAANMATKTYNATFDLEFVHYPASYTLTDNSNARVAEWATALGADIEGPVLLSAWELRQRQ